MENTTPIKTDCSTPDNTTQTVKKPVLAKNKNKNVLAYKTIHIKSFVKKNGTVVKAHDKKIKKRKRSAAGDEMQLLTDAINSLKCE